MIVHNVLKYILRGYKMTYADLALKIGLDLTAEDVKRFFDEESPNAVMIARVAEALGLPTQSADEINNGQTHKDFRRQMIVRGWGYRDLVRKVWPLTYKEGTDRMIDKLQKFFANVSRDSWLIARLCEIFQMQHLPADLFMDEDVPKKKSSQLKLDLED